MLAGLVLPFAWPSPSADELYADARPLLESENPDDWEKAIEKYLDPLERKYPDHYAREIATARTKVRDRQELKRALADGAKVDPHSDAERAYLRGTAAGASRRAGRGPPILAGAGSRVQRRGIGKAMGRSGSGRFEGARSAREHGVIERRPTALRSPRLWLTQRHSPPPGKPLMPSESTGRSTNCSTMTRRWPKTIRQARENK